MKKPMIRGLAVGLVAVLPTQVSALLPAVQAEQVSRDLSALLPEETICVVDLVDGAACLSRVMKLLEPLPKGLPRQVRAVLLGLPLMTRAMAGRDLEDLLTTLAPGPAAFAIYPGRQPFPVFLSRIEDAAEVRRIYKKVAKQLGKKIPYDLTDGVLTVADRPGNLRRVLRFRQRGGKSLLAKANDHQRRATLRPGASLRFYLDLQAVETAVGGEFFEKLPDAAKVLLGPIVRVVDLSERLDGRLDITADGLVLRSTLDAVLGQDRVAKLTARGPQRRAVPAFPEGTLACVSLDRDFGEILRHPEAWLDEDGRLGVAKFLSFADLLLSGASFMEDLVPNIELPLHFFVTKSVPGEDAARPRVTLPAFTLSFGLGEQAKRVKRILEQALVTITAVSNPDRLRAKLVPLSVRRGRQGDYRYQFVSFGDYRGVGDPPTEHGLSPTLLFAHGHGILASTVDGAVRMAVALQASETSAAGAAGETSETGEIGDYVALRGGAIADLVRANLGVLSLDRVLKEGGTRRAAESFVVGLAAVVKALDLDARVQPVGDVTKVEISLRRTKR